MYGPVPDPRHRPRYTWRSLLATYAAATAIPLSLWTLSRPLTAAIALAAVAGLFVASRRTLRAARCLRDCGAFAIDLGDALRITVARRCVDDPC